MDATGKMRRQKLEAIKGHLRYLRVPAFLTLPIMEVTASWILIDDRHRQL